MKLIPVNYQEDSVESQKESKQKYEKMYSATEVKELLEEIEGLSDVLHGAIQTSTNRGTQRMAIPMILRANELVKTWREK